MTHYFKKRCKPKHLQEKKKEEEAFTYKTTQDQITSLVWGEKSKL